MLMLGTVIDVWLIIGVMCLLLDCFIFVTINQDTWLDIFTYSTRLAECRLIKLAFHLYCDIIIISSAWSAITAGTLSVQRRHSGTSWICNSLEVETHQFQLLHANSCNVLRYTHRVVNKGGCLV